MPSTVQPFAAPTSTSSNPTSPDDLSPPNTAFTPPFSESHPAFPGASVYTPTAQPSDSLNPRSCVTCRRRKVRCDKHMPCSNCRRAQIPCIFPAPGRAPRRPRPKDPNAPPRQPSSEREIELVKRLRKLEGIVEELSSQVELETAPHHSSSGNSPEATVNNAPDHATAGSGPRAERADGVAAVQGSPLAPGDCMLTSPSTFPPSSSSVPAQRAENINKQFGRLVINDHGKTRYVSSAFWSQIRDDLDQLRDETQRLTDGESVDSDDESVVAAANNRSGRDHHAFVLGYRSADVNLRSLHPLPSQIPYMWQLYQENVDPIVKVLHIPTTDKLIRETSKNLDSLTPENEALMFAIYFAAITSIDDGEVKKNFDVERARLIKQYRFALEQALGKAEFLVSSEMVVLQAFILFLVLVRRHDDSRFSWTLTGLAIRIGQSMGLHRDGTTFSGLTPFEIEMRRRLFWALCVLDLRSAEDQGTDLTIVDRTFDTELPLNINDADITPDTMEMPQPRQGPTDLTFSLLRYEICALARRLYTMSSAAAGSCPRDACSSLEARENMVREMYRKVESKYFQHSAAPLDPILWTAANLARVITAKMTLVIYQPMLFPGPNDEVLSSDIRDRIFTAATEILEYNHQLNSDRRSKQWRWLFQTYTQWHAVAHMLMDVVRRPWSAAVERAWTALNAIFASPDPEDLKRVAGDQSVWLPLKKIYLKAKKHREAEILRLKADPAAVQQLEMDERGKAGAPLSFAAMAGSVKSAIANERWRTLVDAPRLPPGPDIQDSDAAVVQDPAKQQQQQQQQQQPRPKQEQQQQRQHQRQHQPQHQSQHQHQPQHQPQHHHQHQQHQHPLQPQPPAGLDGETGMSASGMLPGSVNVSGLPGEPNITSDHSMMDFIENAIGQPKFHPESFWPMAFSPQYADLARTEIDKPGLAYMASSHHLSRQDPTHAHLASDKDSGSKAGISGALLSAHAGTQPPPLLDALKVDGNVPAWLWNRPPATGTFNGPSVSVATDSRSRDSPSVDAHARTFSFPVPGGMSDGQHEDVDVDVNMDEDFNWADWGQSLMETTGANTGGVWSAHGI